MFMLIMSQDKFVVNICWKAVCGALKSEFSLIKSVCVCVLNTEEHSVHLCAYMLLQIISLHGV